jgi:poly(hydroxyalkanoate) depolymerase family esterase
MHEGSRGRTEALRPAGGTARLTGTIDRLRARLAIAVAPIAVAAGLLAGSATAAAGTLTSGDYTGPEGTQHYQLYVPSTHQAATPMPLVVALHGCTQTADGFRVLTRWDVLAESQGFIVVFPEQDPSANSFKCWNFFQDGSMHRSAGDPARVAAVTSFIARSYSVDPQRVYAAGLSAGGAMASVMAATYPDLFAAIGVGSGCEYAATATCAGSKSADPIQAGRQAYKEMGSNARQMPFIAFGGDADTTVPPINADQLVQQWLVTNDLVDDGVLNGSVGQLPAKTTVGRAPGGRSYTVGTYDDDHGAELAQHWVVHGMNHAWSGGDPSQPYADASGPDETAAMYAFFLSHPGPPRPPGTTPAPTAKPVVAAGKSGAPTVSKLKLSRGRFVFAISGRGSVTLLLQRRVSGHLKQGRCVAGERKHHRCAKYATAAKIVRTAAKAGQMAITQPTTRHGRRLPRGRYRAVVTPADDAGHAGTSQTMDLVLR